MPIEDHIPDFKSAGADLGGRLNGRVAPSNRTVFIVEDDMAISNAMAIVFEGAGYDPVQILDLDGLEANAGVEASLMILDICLRGCDAVDVIKMLQVRRFKGAIQIISGNSLEILEDIRRLGEGSGLHMLPVLRKPVGADQLLAVVERHKSPRVRLETVDEQAPMGEHPSEAINLGQAIEAGWIEVWYQPKYDVATLEIVGAECLSRVRHPERGVLMPGLFIPNADAADIAALTEMVLHVACADWADFEAAGRPIRLAVNVPGHQIVALPLVKMLRDLAPKSALWPGLVLEITEEEALRDIEAARAISTQLKIYGISLSIDDFGMGYSSFARLREIPFKEIKLDRSLVDGCAGDEVKGALCRSVIDLAHFFGAKAVAEGVERQEDFDHLRRIRCDLAQGYFCARPMPKDDLLATLEGNCCVGITVPEVCALPMAEALGTC